MKLANEFWLIIGWIIGGMGSAFYHQLTPSVAGCSGGKMSILIPVNISAAASGLLLKVLLSIRNPR
ncbi:MAG: hypothetical protein RL110_641 [Bacteroidota bacterium]|jgi:hypothetical protein